MKSSRCLLLAFSLALAGCGTPATNAPRPADAFASLQKQMTALEVKSLLGEPATVRAFKSEPFPSEVWVYHRKIPGPERQVPIRTQEVPAVNPITGLPFMRQEPVYETQVTTINETVELLLVEQRLIAWKSNRQAASGVEFR